MARVMLDSSCVIALISPDDGHRLAIQKAVSVKDQFSISAITLAEALVYGAKSGDLKKHRDAIMGLPVTVVDVSSEIAVAAAQIRADSNIKIPDAIISATATMVKAQLWTFDAGLANSHKGAVLIS